MYKTPLNVRKRRSVISENNAMKTPAGALGTSVVEPSVLNTPEEPGKVSVIWKGKKHERDPNMFPASMQILQAGAIA